MDAGETGCAMVVKKTENYTISVVWSLMRRKMETLFIYGR